MSKVVLKAENISKQYRLGLVGTGTLRDDFKRNWARLCGKEDPFLKVGELNDRSKKSNGDYVWALKDINFEVKQGEVLGIIGKNGAGKSTLLKILSRVTSPSTGSIKSRGRIASLLEVGTGFHPELTGRENIYLNGAILGMNKSEINSKLDEIIDFSGCERYIDTPTKRYSSGMTVRLGFAVAAHLEPEILVVDEVLAVGDAEFQKKAIGKMQDISQGEGRTVLFVSHNMASVQSLCARGILLENGELNYLGNIEDTIQKYLKNKDLVEGLSLNERLDRRGRGQFKLSKIRLSDFRGEEIDVFLSGQDIHFEVEILSQSKDDIKVFRLDFGLNDKRGNRISWFSTSLFEENFTYKKNESIRLSMIIQNTPLNVGNYTLTANLIINGYNEDWIDNAVSFSIEEGDFFKTGKKIPANQGSFLIKHKFCLNESL